MMSVVGLAKPLSEDHKLTNDDEKKESNEQEDMYNKWEADTDNLMDQIQDMVPLLQLDNKDLRLHPDKVDMDMEVMEEDKHLLHREDNLMEAEDMIKDRHKLILPISSRFWIPDIWK